MRRLLVMAVLTVSLGACSSETPARSTFTLPPAEPTTVATVPPQPIPAAANRLVVVSPDGSVLTMRPDGSDVTTIAAGAPDTLHFQPQWSPHTSELAWGEAGPTGFAVVVTDGVGDGRRSVQTANLPFYLYWAPDGQRLVALYNGPAGDVEARYVDVAAGTTRVIGNDAPYYFAWEPDSSRIVAHVGSASLVIVGVDGSSSTLAGGSPLYQAPDWTPRGIFHLGADGIRLVAGSGGFALVAVVDGPVWFSADARGDRIAVQPLATEQAAINVRYRAAPQLAADVLSVVDVDTGEVAVLTSTPSPAFFWSPDGSTLAYLVDGEAPGSLRWMLWGDGETESLATFTPPPSFLRGVLPFAGQYALSLNLWSPASDAIAFPGLIDGTAGIWVQGTDGADPQLVAEGSWVAWSYR